MRINTRRDFFGKLAAMVAFLTGAPNFFGQQAPAAGTSNVGSTPKSGPSEDTPRRPGGNNHTLNGIYYFSGTGSNDGYSREDHILVTDPFEKHVTRTMDALKKSVERAGCTMDSIIHLQVFLCLPLAETPTPTGRARRHVEHSRSAIPQTCSFQGREPSSLLCRPYYKDALNSSSVTAVATTAFDPSY